MTVGSRLEIPEGFPTASFHKLAQALKAALARPPFALQIGAMDGVSYDLLHPHLSNGGWQGLLVEPMPDMFARLRQTYAAQPHLTFVNCAVADHDGELNFKRVDPEAIKQGLVFERASGVTSAMQGRGIIGDADKQGAHTGDIAAHLQDVVAPCVTLQRLLTEHAVTHIDLLMIDTEGADWMIARQLDLTRYRPLLVCMEYTSLMGPEMVECCQHFQAHSYQFALCEEDDENLLFVPKPAAT